PAAAGAVQRGDADRRAAGVGDPAAGGAAGGAAHALLRQGGPDLRRRAGGGEAAPVVARDTVTYGLGPGCDETARKRAGAAPGVLLGGSVAAKSAEVEVPKCSVRPGSGR